MVQLTRIYTGGGDKGKTSLGSGQRVSKNAARIRAIGTVDEANALLGLVRLHTQGAPEIDRCLAGLQNDLFDLGADLCLPEDPKEGTALRLRPDQAAFLERQMDLLNTSLRPLKSFVLPGGSPASAHLHHARTVVRRAERDICALIEEEGEKAVSPPVVRYLNRLSDYLFVLARSFNDQGAGDVLWVPGGANAAQEAGSDEEVSETRPPAA